MSPLENLRWQIVGFLGRIVFRLWIKSCRMTVLGREAYDRLRSDRIPVVLMVWHGRIFLVPYYFRNRGIMPLISPSRDGEIPARIMSGWGYKILRGSGSHVIKDAWLSMQRELEQGGEVIIVPDGPRGPDRIAKLGGFKLAQKTGACLVPFTFSGARTKVLDSWDRFLMVKPFSRIVVLFGDPVRVDPSLSGEELEAERLRFERDLAALDERADRYFAELS